MVFNNLDRGKLIFPTALPLSFFFNNIIYKCRARIKHYLMKYNSMCYVPVTQFSQIRITFGTNLVSVVLRKDTDQKNDSAYKEQNYWSVCTKVDETRVQLMKDKVVQFVDCGFILKFQKCSFYQRNTFCTRYVEMYQ